MIEIMAQQSKVTDHWGTSESEGESCCSCADSSIDSSEISWWRLQRHLIVISICSGRFESLRYFMWSLASSSLILEQSRPWQMIPSMNWNYFVYILFMLPLKLSSILWDQTAAIRNDSRIEPTRRESQLLGLALDVTNTAKIEFKCCFVFVVLHLYWGLTLEPSNGSIRQYILKWEKITLRSCWMGITYKIIQNSKGFKLQFGLPKVVPKEKAVGTKETCSDPTQVLEHLDVHPFLTLSWRQLEVVSLGFAVLVVGGHVLLHRKSLHQKPGSCGYQWGTIIQPSPWYMWPKYHNLILCTCILGIST